MTRTTGTKPVEVGSLADLGFRLLKAFILIAVLFLICVVIAAGTSAVADAMGLTSKQATSSKESPAPVAEQPIVVSTPVDYTWLWGVGGTIAGLLLLGVTVWSATRFIRHRKQKAARAQRLTASWQHFHDQHDELLRSYLHAETDWNALFFTPALTDPSVPQTRCMLKAMRRASDLRITNGTAPASATLGTDLTKLPYPEAVADFAHAWEAAANHARRVGQENIPEGERLTINEIRTLLGIAENSGASETERSLAYRRVHSLVKTLRFVHVPQKALLQLEESHRLALEGGVQIAAETERVFVLAQ